MRTFRVMGFEIYSTHARTHAYMHTRGVNPNGQRFPCLCDSSWVMLMSAIL